jgi:mRNA interferase MazF
MGPFMKGDVVIVPFPFSDLTNSKRRPAVVVASLSGDDVILCQVTSQSRLDSYAINIAGSDFVSGNLQKDSIARPNRLFTADGRIVIHKAGVQSKDKMQEITNKILDIIIA